MNEDWRALSLAIFLSVIYFSLLLAPNKVAGRRANSLLCRSLLGWSRNLPPGKEDYVTSLQSVCIGPESKQQTAEWGLLLSPVPPVVPEWSWSLKQLAVFFWCFCRQAQNLRDELYQAKLRLEKESASLKESNKVLRWNHSYSSSSLYFFESLNGFSISYCMKKNTFTSGLLCYTVCYHNDQQSLVFRFEILVPIGSKVCSCSPLSISKALMVKLETAENKASNLDMEVSKKYTQSVYKHFICC